MMSTSPVPETPDETFVTPLTTPSDASRAFEHLHDVEQAEHHAREADSAAPETPVKSIANAHTAAPGASQPNEKDETASQKTARPVGSGHSIQSSGELEKEAVTEARLITSRGLDRAQPAPEQQEGDPRELLEHYPTKESIGEVLVGLGNPTTASIRESLNDGEDDVLKYPSGPALALLTVGLCLATFVVALDNSIIGEPCRAIKVNFCNSIAHNSLQLLPSRRSPPSSTV